SFSFFILILFSAVNLFIKTIFVAQRNAKIGFIIETITQAMKLLLISTNIFPFDGSVTMLVVFSSAYFISTIFGFLFFLPRHNVNLPKPIPKKKTIKEITNFSLGNHVSKILSLAPSMIYVSYVSIVLSPQLASYFYIYFMVANPIYSLGIAISTAFLTESTYIKEKKIFTYQTRKVVKVLYIALVVLIPLAILVSPFLFLFFSKSYLDEYVSFFILVLASIPIYLNRFFMSLMNILKIMRNIIFLNLISTSISLILPYFLSELIGLNGFSISWLIGQTIASIYGIYKIILLKRNKNLILNINTVSQN
ncbi:MAG: hypothetical protein ACTSRR_12030, partial [Candidatus Heimdallarchaeaceae archaeon]